MSSKITTIAAILVVISMMTGGVVVGVYGATGVAVDSSDSTSTTDRPTAGQSETTRLTTNLQPQQDSGSVNITPGETVTGEVKRGDSARINVFDIERGETATIEFTLDAPPENDTEIKFRTPDGRTVRTLTDGGQTKTVSFQAEVSGTATFIVSTGDRPVQGIDGGSYRFTLNVSTVGEEPNDERTSATELEVNTTRSATLDGAEVDYYTFTLPEFQTPDFPRIVKIPVTVTIDRESRTGVSALQVDTAAADDSPNTGRLMNRYVGTGNPTNVHFTGTEGDRYYIAVVNVNEGGGPYNLTLSINTSGIDAERAPPENGERQSLDEIAQAAYGLQFDELSNETSQLVRAVYNNQDSETKLSKDELAQMRYDMSFEMLSEETKEEITILYQAQSVDGQG